MSTFVATVEMEFTTEEILELRKLADLQETTVEIVARDCMMQKVKELLSA